MYRSVLCLLLVSYTMQSVARYVEPRCLIPDSEKTNCGHPGIQQRQCEERGCCFNNEPTGVPWCYQAKVIRNFMRPTQFRPIFPTTPTQPPVMPTTTAAPNTTTTAAPTTTTTTTTAAPTTRPTTTRAPNTRSNPHKMSILALVQMIRDGVPQDIINNLLADAVPNGELMFALRDGRLDRNEYLRLMKGPGINFNALVAYRLTGGNVNSMIYERLARTYGVDSMAVQLMMSNRKDAAARHLAARMTPTSNANPLNSLILRAVTSGQGLTRTNVMDYYIDQTYRSHSRLAREAQKAIVRGDLRTAVSFMLLDANRGRRTFNESYERNEALFAFMVDNQKSHPGRINPGIIMSLAQDQKINALPDKDFMELFGVSAFDYVCAAHQPSLRLPCSKLRGNTYHSSLDCINAGCCLAQASFPDERPICYDNLLGGVGVGLVKHIWDEDFIIRTVFNNQLPTLESFYPDGIPWIPSRDVPASLSNAGALDPNQPNWFGSLNVNGVMLHPRPTGLPIGPNKFRPNFVWTPHGPTPFPTLMPQDGSRVVPAVTSSPGVVGGPYVPPAGSSPIVMGLNLNNMASCRGVQRNDRYECMPNLQSMVPGGEAACGRLDCCFDPVWNDMSVPACFRKANYGQCHSVAPADRQDCGEAGISQEECISNPRCCYDSTINPARYRSPVPWCYYKLQSFVTEEERCSRVAHANRIGCFPVNSMNGLDINDVVTRQTCESGSGCCYEQVTLSFLERGLGVRKPPTCYKKMSVVIAPTQAAPTTTAAPAAPAPVCKDRDTLAPTSREDCGQFDYHECVRVKGCCYMPEILIPGAPWCFKKT